VCEIREQLILFNQSTNPTRELLEEERDIYPTGGAITNRRGKKRKRLPNLVINAN